MGLWNPMNTKLTLSDNMYAPKNTSRIGWCFIYGWGWWIATGINALAMTWKYGSAERESTIPHTKQGLVNEEIATSLRSPH